jgi:vitamin B12/bleomycin/antimicrobial peptide transport system ATP-binding/permease protein
VAAPRYFSGAIQLGALMQVASAFGRVPDALSWFVDSYWSLAEWKASVDRLLAFSRGMRAAAAAPGGEGRIRVVTHPGDEIALDRVDIALPSGRTLVRDAAFVIRRGEHVLLAGPSGSGKSTIFRAIAGLWPYGRGEIRRPAAERMLFLPQRPYLPIAPLREAVAYPSDPRALGDAAIVNAHRTVLAGRPSQPLRPPRAFARIRCARRGRQRRRHPREFRIVSMKMRCPSRDRNKVYGGPRDHRKASQ